MQREHRHLNIQQSLLAQMYWEGLFNFFSSYVKLFFSWISKDGLSWSNIWSTRHRVVCMIDPSHLVLAPIGHGAYPLTTGQPRGSGEATPAVLWRSEWKLWGPGSEGDRLWTAPQAKHWALVAQACWCWQQLLGVWVCIFKGKELFPQRTAFSRHVWYI